MRTGSFVCDACQKTRSSATSISSTASYAQRVGHVPEVKLPVEYFCRFEDSPEASCIVTAERATRWWKRGSLDASSTFIASRVDEQRHQQHNGLLFKTPIIPSDIFAGTLKLAQSAFSETTMQISINIIIDVRIKHSNVNNDQSATSPLTRKSRWTPGGVR